MAPVPQPTISPAKFKEIEKKEAFYEKLISDQQVAVDQNCKRAIEWRNEANNCNTWLACVNLTVTAKSWEEICEAGKDQLSDIKLIMAGYGDIVERIHQGERDNKLLNDIDSISRNLEDINRKIGF